MLQIAFALQFLKAEGEGVVEEATLFFFFTKRTRRKKRIRNTKAPAKRTPVIIPAWLCMDVEMNGAVCAMESVTLADPE